MREAPLVLLVDDEALILNLLEMAFVEAGYEVMLAGDGERALQELETDASRFRGVVTDIRLGSGPNGWDIGRRARELSSQIAIVYLSGDSGHDWSSKGMPESLMVAKPFAVAQVITALSGLLVQDDTRRTG